MQITVHRILSSITLSRNYIFGLFWPILLFSQLILAYFYGLLTKFGKTVKYRHIHLNIARLLIE